MKCRKCEAIIADGSKYCNQCGAKQEIGASEKKKKTRGNGTGTAFRRGNTWTVEVVVYWDKENKKRTRRTKGGFKTKKEALAYAPILKGMKREPKDFTLKHYYDAWEPSANLSESKRSAYHTAWGKMEKIYYIPVDQLDIVTLQLLFNEKASTYYPARDMRVLLSKLLELAIADGLISVNYSKYITIPPCIEKETDAFNEAEIRKLWEAYDSGDDFVGYLLLMIYTGMMPGELFRLKKSMIDWNNKVISDCGIKTKVRKRTPMVMADCIIPVLQRLCLIAPGENVFYMQQYKFYTTYHEVMKKYGCRDLKPYTCRHTTATALVLGYQVAPSVIQKVMRHANFITTQRYIHPQVQDALNAVNTISVPK